MTQPTLTQQSTTGSVPLRPVRRFTGWHMTAILVAFFAVVIIVNVYMAKVAIGTFGGEVVENSYVASQRFNTWLDEAKAERALGWHVAVTPAGDGIDVALSDASARTIDQAHVTGIAMHPLGVTADRDLAFHEVRPGLYHAALPAGRWQVRLDVVWEGHHWRTANELNAGNEPNTGPRT